MAISASFAGSLAPTEVNAQLSSSAGASILFFPLIAADGQRDTMIQITNSSNNAVHARCFYVAVGASLLQSTEFRISLTKQQPTQWIVSRGRVFDPSDPRCSILNPDCEGAGFDPGFGGFDFNFGFFIGAPIPSTPAGFVGSMICIETDSAGDRSALNSLIGVATIVDSISDAVAYVALGSTGNPDDFSASPTILLRPDATLNGTGDANACPETLVLNHTAEGSEDPLLGSGSSVRTRIAAMPCSVDLATLQPAVVNLQFEITTDLGDTFTTSAVVDGFLEVSLADISNVFGVDTLGSSVARTTITAAPGGVVIVASEQRTTAQGTSGSAALLLHLGDSELSDAIVLPNP